MESFITLICIFLAVSVSSAICMLLPPIGDSVGIALLYLLVFGLNTWFFYFKLAKKLTAPPSGRNTRNKKNNRSTKSSSQVNVTTFSEPNTPSYKLCKFIWTRTIIFCNGIFPVPSLKCNTDIWTAFFYCIAKCIRKQNIVDEIYTQFIPSAIPFISGADNTKASEQYIQSCYWQFRTELNNSNLDPRNDKDLSQLWELTAHRISVNPADIKKFELAFAYNVKLLTDHALTLYHLKSSETVYYVEAANGMTVRVPENRLEAWQAEQDRIRNNPDTAKLTEKEQMLVDAIVRDIYGSKGE